MTIGTVLDSASACARGCDSDLGYSSGWGYGPSGGIGLVLLSFDPDLDGNSIELDI